MYGTIIVDQFVFVQKRRKLYEQSVDILNSFFFTDSDINYLNNILCTVCIRVEE